MTTIDRPTIENWLRTLLLGQYAESFLDNGYDDLEICKQIGEQDLDAIGVFNPTHRFKMLEAVRKLREEGATAVYFTVEEVLRSSMQTCQCGSAGGVPSASPSSGRRSPCQYCIGGGGGSGSVASRERPESRVASPTAAAAENGSGPSQQPPELKRLASPKLRQTLQNKLVIDGIKLYNYPYSTRDGSVGYLNGLASRYADDVQTHYQDVLHQLDILRQRVWLQMAAQQQQLQHEQRPLSPPSPAAAAADCMPPPQQQQPDITQSVQPIYTPGKYLPSSCLSDDDEDEIYGFGYGVLDTRSRPQSRQGSAAARQPYGTDSPTYGFTARYPGDRNMRYLPDTATERKAKKRGKLRKLFHTLKLSKHGNAPATNKRKRVRSSRDSAAPVLMPGSSQFVTSTPHRTAGDEAQMFKALERDRMQEQIWLHESSGEALMLRSRDSDVGNEDISPSGPVAASFRTRPAGAGSDVWWSAGGAVASGPWLDEPGLTAAGTPDSEPDDRRLLPPASVCPSVFSPSDSSLRDRLVMSRPPSVPPASTCGSGGAFSVQRYYQNVGYTLAPATGGDLLPAAPPPVSAADRVALLAGHQLHPTANHQQMIISMADLTLRQQQHHHHYRSSAANS